MRNTSTDGVGLFDPAAFLENRETSLAAAALICGLSIDDFDSLTIDDFVTAARQTFCVASRPLTTRLFGDTGIQDRVVNGPHLWNRKMQQKVLHKIRCDWRDRHMAKWVIDNG